jgi:hypothetical protein
MKMGWQSFLFTEAQRPRGVEINFGSSGRKWPFHNDAIASSFQHILVPEQFRTL